MDHALRIFHWLFGADIILGNSNGNIPSCAVCVNKIEQVKGEREDASRHSVDVDTDTVQFNTTADVNSEYRTTTTNQKRQPTTKI